MRTYTITSAKRKRIGVVRSGLTLLALTAFAASSSVLAGTQQHIVDFNGDGRTDYAVVRNTGGGPGGQITWFVQTNEASGDGQFTAFQWGATGDRFVPEDYDGDDKTDIAVWRPGSSANFYIFQSSTGTFRIDQFGQTGDSPAVVRDYTGDGKADPAVYRGGQQSGDQSFWFYRASSGPLSGQVVYTQWGQNGDFPAPGDYNGDGIGDFCVQRNIGGGGNAGFFLLPGTGGAQTSGGGTVTRFGNATDRVVTGDYDGDGKNDLAFTRSQAGEINWYILQSTDGMIQQYIFGISSTDFTVQGDYDGDGKTDVAVWRPSGTLAGNFIVQRSTGGFSFYRWGQNLDYPVANYNTF